MTTYRLTSTPLVHTPGIIAWAQAGARTAPAQFAKIVSETYGLPIEIARALVTKKLAYSIDGETVTFTA